MHRPIAETKKPVVKGNKRSATDIVDVASDLLAGFPFVLFRGDQPFELTTSMLLQTFTMHHVFDEMRERDEATYIANRKSGFMKFEKDGKDYNGTYTGFLDRRDAMHSKAIDHLRKHIGEADAYEDWRLNHINC
ncbi:hypothetical protein V6N11_025208 [Hibiscus sabdariffa]|uniref:Uncharacterized protein n=1 Tax=Hibiscus sabdariffa TaxID=183260 RepID=A0ABR2QPE8_9ROSI